MGRLRPVRTRADRADGADSVMVDVLVVGSGAGGAPLALQLSRAGFRVLVLEKGPRHAPEQYTHDEVQLATAPEAFIPRLSDEPRVLVHADRPADAELTSMGWTACCVGGGTVRMGGTFYRFHPDDFRLRTRAGAYEALADWPYGYDDLEPYYTEAEWVVGVSGAGGAPPGAPRSAGYPMPPLDCHPLAATLDAACHSLGLHPASTPRAINARPYNGRPACRYCTFCAGYGCPIGARGSAQAALLPPAEATGNCEVRADAMVREITVDQAGLATGCIYLDSAGVERRVTARVVCVACSAIESARLLLLSTSVRFPNGLANSSGLVGRCLQFKCGTSLSAAFGRRGLTEAALRDPNPFLGRSVWDYYFTPAGVGEVAKGGVMRFDMERIYPIALAQRAARDEAGGLLWGEALARRVREYFCDRREVECEIFQDFVPNDGTYVDLAPGVVDRWGLPVARIHVAEPAHHARVGGWLAERAREVFDRMGADGVRVDGVGYINDVMAHGTCRAGTDPATSVLNAFCQTHEVRNLFVVDGSFMPTSGGGPTALTIIANSLRTAAYIADRARTGELA